MPAHLTHLLQPLDVVVFQPYKHYHGKAVDRLVRDGINDLGKLEFLALIESVRDQAFKSIKIVSAFKKTGIWPFIPDVVLLQVAQRHEETTPPPLPNLTSSEPNTPYRYRSLIKSAYKI